MSYLFNVCIQATKPAFIMPSFDFQITWLVLCKLELIALNSACLLQLKIISFDHCIETTFFRM